MPHLPSSADVPLPRVTAHLRQLSHDIRNSLNAIQLEASLLRQISRDPDAVESIDRIRAQALELGTRLKTMSARFRLPEAMKVQLGAGELLEFIRTEGDVRPELRITWRGQNTRAEFEADPVLVREIFRELFENAVRFPASGDLVMSCQDAAREIRYELLEPKSEVLVLDGWGEAFFTTSPGCSGLGLWWVHAAAQRIDATFSQRFQESPRALISTLTLPRASA